MEQEYERNAIHIIYHFFVHETPIVAITILYVSSMICCGATQDWDRNRRHNNSNGQVVFLLFPSWLGIGEYAYNEEMRYLSTTKMTTTNHSNFSLHCAARIFQLVRFISPTICSILKTTTHRPPTNSTPFLVLHLLSILFTHPKRPMLLLPNSTLPNHNQST